MRSGDITSAAVVAAVTVPADATEEAIAQAVIDAHGQSVSGCPFRPAVQARD